MKIFAGNFRGFRTVEIDLAKISFLVGDNSSGKSSLIYLVHAVSKNDITAPPKFQEEFGVGEYDYFSPYFDYADVTFGYSADDGDDHFIKAITVKRNKSGEPSITRCTYFVDGKIISFKSDGEGVSWKIIQNYNYSNNIEFMNYHNKIRRYKKAENVEGIGIANPTMIFACLDYKVLGLQSATSKVFTSVLDATRLVSPLRALPEKFYSSRRKFNAHGLHFATMWIDFAGTAEQGPFERTRRFGKESGLFDSIKVRRVSATLDESPLIVTVKKSNKEFSLNQVGVGVSQVVPVLMETIFALEMPDTPVLIQQPELHLHPVAQAALGSYFYDACVHGLRGVLETHSSFLLDRFRAEVRDADMKPKAHGEATLRHEDAVILFCRNGPEGNQVDYVSIDAMGKLQNEPEAFHEFFVDELLRTMF